MMEVGQVFFSGSFSYSEERAIVSLSPLVSLKDATENTSFLFVRGADHRFVVRRFCPQTRSQ